MFDVIKGYLQLTIQFIDSLFFIKIDLMEGFDVYLGVLVITYVVILLILYFIFKALGIIEKE